MILPDKTEMLMRLDDMSEAMNSYVKRVIYNKEEKLVYLSKMFESHSFEAKIDINEKEVELLLKRYEQVFLSVIQNVDRKVENSQQDLDFMMKKLLHVKENSLTSLSSIFEGNNPAKGIQESYAQIVVKGKKSSLKTLQIDDVFELQNKDDIILAKVLEKR